MNRPPRKVYIGHHRIRREERRRAKVMEERASKEATDSDVRSVVEAARKRELKAEKLRKIAAAGGIAPARD